MMNTVTYFQPSPVLGIIGSQYNSKKRDKWIKPNIDLTS